MFNCWSLKMRVRTVLGPGRSRSPRPMKPQSVLDTILDDSGDSRDDHGGMNGYSINGIDSLEQPEYVQLVQSVQTPIFNRKSTC